MDFVGYLVAGVCCGVVGFIFGIVALVSYIRGMFRNF